jgi:PA14 domain-containing protein/concanavalin A-like lectin/glucanase superfamily protein/glycosyl hydrolase family 127 (putative beta-L-arabinofuranosidase)/glycosyl hydrolase family 2/beta-L-arabinofuranosidase (glycosyl hydrolase family 127)/3-keto-disaccharide hydrolase/putative Ig domain-containing protein
MRFFSNTVAAVLLMGTLFRATPAGAWQMRQAPLMTDFAQQVDTNNPLPEYPRPQMARSNWMSLNGIWQFQAGSSNDAVPINQTLSGQILVPFPMESAISGVKQYHDRAWYRRTFTVPAGWSGQRILLHLDAVDWESEVFVNGVSVGIHKGGYDPATYDITPNLSGTGPQELIVRIYDPTDGGGQPRGKQTLYPGGIMYTSCSGIWQPVWLEPVPATSVAAIKLVPDIDNQLLSVTVALSGPANGITVNAVARVGSNIVSTVSGSPGSALMLPVPNPTLWTPTNPFLYDLDITVSNAAARVDSVTSYFGMRKISLGTTNGFVKMLLNNQFVFQFGPLDQGFWPDGIYTAPTDNALRGDLEKIKAVGWNMVRKHIKVERPRWYYWADKLGVLVWQDMPSVNSYTGSPQIIQTNQFETELLNMVQNRWNHPSIIMWVIFNESQGQHDTAELVQEVKALDPSRLVNQASGGNFVGAGDILDTHSYPSPAYPVSTNQAVVCGEFGGVGLAITNHTWANGWGYVGATNGDDLTAKFESFAAQLCDFVPNHGLSAAVYTELTDVETELNGFFTYDRKVRKPDIQRTRVAILAPSGQYNFTPVVPTSQSAGQNWKYTTTAPAGNWYAPEFVDAGWSNGPGGFGTSATPGAVVRTTWNTGDIWLRRTFNPGSLTTGQISNLVWNIHHDENVEVYLNSVPVFSAGGFTSAYGRVPFGDAARTALLNGADNTLAVHCHQTTGGQYIDVGIDSELVITPPPQPAAAPAWIENGTGLHGDYFNGIAFSHLVLQRTDPLIDFDWNLGSPASGVSNEQFSVRWTGFIQPRYSEVYTFHLTADDGCRLWVNDQLLIDKWRADSGTEVSGSVALTGGQRHSIRVEYYDNTVFARAKLEWESASQTREIVPAGVLFADTNAPGVPSPTNLPPTAVVTNRAPLVATPFSALPLGSVRPLGWLLTQCQEQRDGLTGNAETIYAGDIGTNSAWLGGAGDNWERSPYYYKGLVALAYTLNDAGLKQKAQKWMDWILDHQGPDGYIGPASNNDWWPRMIATYALKDYYEATADARVPSVLSNYFRYMRANLISRPLQDWGKARAGDEMDVALWLYNRNGDTNLLSLVNLLRQQAYDWPGIMTSNNFMLFGTDFQPKHNVNVEQALKMPMIYYQLSQQASDEQAMGFGLDHLMHEHALSCGINSGTEFLSGNASVQGVELCSIVEAMLSLETAIRISGDAMLGDRLEKISFNALPAGLANNIKGIQYYTLPNNVIVTNGGHGFNQDYANGTLPGPNSGFPCCRYNFHMGWPKFVQNSWAATSDGGLAALAYGPTVVNAMAGGSQVAITEDTSYPFEEQVRLRISVGNVVSFPLVLRIPGWCSNATISVNGQLQAGATAGSFFRIERNWTNGDLVTMNFPMSIQTEVGPEQSVAIDRGPLVYSLEIGENWTVRTPDPLGLGFDEFELHPTTPWAYALQLNPTNPAASLTFTNFTTPLNPFDPAQPSARIMANARLVPGWTNGWRGTHAFEPPASPTSSTNPLQAVTLVPFGSQHLRVSWFPWLGSRAAMNSFTETFDTNWSQRWTVFGGNWSRRNNTLSTVPASANGAKALAMQTSFSNFTYEGDVLVGTAGDAGLIFRVSKPDIGADAYCGYYAGIDAQNGRLVFGYASNSWHEVTSLQMSFLPRRFYHLKVQAIGSRIRIFVSDTNQPVLDLQDGTFAAGMIGVRHYCNDGNQSISSFSNLIATAYGTTTAEVPAAWYPFENGAQDNSGNGNHGTISGGVTFPAGKLGAHTAQFDGSSNTYIGIPRVISDQFTVAFWMKTTATGGSGQWWSGEGLVDGEVPNVANDFGVSLVGSKVAFGVGNPDTTILTSASVNDGLWHHVTATRDSISGEMDLYLDGTLQATTIGPQGTRAAPPMLRIGSVQTGVAGGFFLGSIDDVQIFNRVFAPGEVSSLMNHPPSLSPVFDGSVLAGRTIAVSNAAADPDSPAQTLSYSLSSAPSGATINATNGVMGWRPAIAQSGSNYPIAVRVSDNGTPPMSATQTFAIGVLPPAKPSVSQPMVGSGGFQMMIEGDAGPDYSVYSATDLALNFSAWTWLLTTNPATLPFQFIDPTATNYGRRFYRVLLGP